MRLLLLITVIGLAPAARAACEAPYTTESLVTDLSEVERSLRGGDTSVALRHTDALRAGLECLDAPLRYEIAPRVYLAMGATYTVAGDVVRGHGWLLTGLELFPGFAWEIADLPSDSTLPATLDSLRDVAADPPREVPGVAFVDGEHYLDGTLTGVRATPGRPHLYQWDIAGTLHSRVIEGNQFPEEVLVAALSDPATPVTRIEPEFLVPVRPPEKTPLLVGGAAGIVASGVLYGLAFDSRSRFDEATTEQQVRTRTTVTRGLLLSSAGVFAASASVLTWGIVVGEGSSLGPRLSGRF